MTTIRFGKHRNCRLADVPANYVFWLAGYRWDGSGMNEDVTLSAIDNVWENREAIRSACFCGPNVADGCHRDDCYGYVLRDTLDATTSEFVRCSVNGSAKFTSARIHKSRCWVMANHPKVIEEAKTFIDDNRLCWKCHNKLTPIGDRRANGVGKDWDSRCLHKRCYWEWKEENP